MKSRGLKDKQRKFIKKIDIVIRIKHIKHVNRTKGTKK